MQHSLKQSTYNSYDSYAKNHFKPALGNIRLQDLTSRMLQQFYNYKIEHESLAPKTVRNINLYLHKALGQAQKEGLILQNPATGVNLPRNQRPRVEILTRDKQALLVRASYQHRYGVFVRLVLVTGIRMGELLGLRWEDIDFRTSMLYVKRTLNRLQKRNLPADHEGPRTEIVIQEPKTENSYRSIPLLPAVVQELLQWQTTQNIDAALIGERYECNGMIVTNPLGGYIEPRTFSDYYHEMLNAAGLRHFTFHALRHTYAVLALQNGDDFKTVQENLGHATASFTLDVYGHVSARMKTESASRMEGYIQSLSDE
jgi:Site-specific recombinase XerD